MRKEIIPLNIQKLENQNFNNMKILRVTAAFIILLSCSDSTKNNLGNNFYIMEGDRMEDKVMVYCTGNDYTGCYAGIYIVPCHEMHYDSIGLHNSYVIGAAINDDFIAIETYQKSTSDTSYWVVDKSLKFILDTCSFECEKLIANYRRGPFERTKFIAYLTEQEIRLRNVYGNSKTFLMYEK